MVPYFVVVLAGRQARLRPPPRLAQFLLGPFFNLSMGVQYKNRHFLHTIHPVINNLLVSVTITHRMRSKHHDAAIASVSAVNRIAAFYGIGLIYTGDPAVRRQVAAFCMEVVRVLFDNRR